MFLFGFSSLVFAGIALAGPSTPAESSSATKAEGIVVLPVLGTNGAPSPDGNLLRQAIRDEGASGVLSRGQTQKRLATLAAPPTTDIAAQKKLVGEAEEAFNAFDVPRSVALLDEVVAQLSTDLDVSDEKRVMLEEVQMQLVRRLMGVAGPEETGRGETAEGKKARATLVNLLRQNPRLNLSPDRFPPKLRRLLEGARTELSKAGLVGLFVESEPQSAKVFVEGRVLGLTPLRLPQALAPGRYRIWLEKDDQRSSPRVVDVRDKKVELLFDLAFESTIDTEQVALRPKTPHVPEELAFRVGSLVHAKQLILVGIANYDGAQWLYGASFDPAKRETLLRGAVRLGASGVSSESIRKLAVFLAKGTPKELNPNKVPLSGDETKVAVVAKPPEDESDGTLPWVVAGGVTAGVLVAVAAAAGTAGLIFAALQPPAVELILVTSPGE